MLLGNTRSPLRLHADDLGAEIIFLRYLDLDSGQRGQPQTDLSKLPSSAHVLSPQ